MLGVELLLAGITGLTLGCILGSIGLVVPWLTGIKRGLTPLAASLLIVIMIGATVISV